MGRLFFISTIFISFALAQTSLRLQGQVHPTFDVSFRTDRLGIEVIDRIPDDFGHKIFYQGREFGRFPASVRTTEELLLVNKIPWRQLKEKRVVIFTIVAN